MDCHNSQAAWQQGAQNPTLSSSSWKVMEPMSTCLASTEVSLSLVGRSVGLIHITKRIGRIRERQFLSL